MKQIFTLALVFSFVFATNIKTNNTKLTRVAPISNNTVYSYAPILKKVMHSVVNISVMKVTTTKVSEKFDNHTFKNIPQKRIEYALGSGVIISSDGYIATNNHVISHAKKIYVFMHNKKRYKAKLIGSDPKTDLAVIKIDAKNLTPITFTNSNKIEIGDIVLAIGNPFGLGETATQGIVSGLNRDAIGLNDYEDFIQTDAPINPGNSGGALVDLKGRLVGINSAIYTKSGGNNGVGFAIPSNMVKFVAKELINKGFITRGYLGVEISDVNTNESSLYGIDYGVFVNKVMPNTPAYKAGFQAGDIIIALNGKKVRDGASLRNKIAFLGAGSKVSITIFRNHKKIILSAILKTLPKFSNQIPLLEGATIMQNNNKLFVFKISQNSIASLLKLKKGDELMAIKTIKTKKWVPIHSIKQLKNILKNIHDSEALLKINSQNQVEIIQL